MADSLDNFGIRLDLDISGSQAEMIKAENELRKFQSELKKSTDTADITKLTASIGLMDDKIAHLNQRMGEMAKPTGDATQSLINLSRIAQDAPYGFMGIANNLNPMLESFQRLQKESNGAGNALKAMLSGLAGPAGIGVAVGVASALLSKFGDKLFESSEAQKKAAEKSKEHADALKQEKDAIEQIYSSTAKEATQVSSLVAVLDNENETRNRKQKALEELKKINPEIFGALKLEQNAVNGLNTAYDAYINNLSSLITLKIKQKELEDVTEKILKIQGATLTQEEKDIKATGKAINDKVNAQRTDNEQRNIATKALTEQNKKELELNILLEQRKKIFDNIKDVSSGVKIQGEGNTTKDKESPFTKATKDFEAALNAETALVRANLVGTQKDLDNKINIYEDYIKKLGAINTDQAKAKIEELLNPLGELQGKKMEDRVKQSLKAIDLAVAEVPSTPEDIKNEDKFGVGSKTVLNRFTGETGTAQGEKQFNIQRKDLDEFWKEQEKKSKEAQKAAENFANFLAGGLTNGIMNMWDALENGDSALEAFGNFLKDMVKQLAAAVIQAVLFKAIMTSLGFGGVGGGGTGGGSGLGGLLGIPMFAEGGIVSRPTLGMVGEGGQSEAIMPLNKLGNMMNSTFNAGAMSGQGGGGNGQFVLKGNDLVLALQRSNYSLNLRRGA